MLRREKGCNPKGTGSNEQRYGFISRRKPAQEPTGGSFFSPRENGRSYISRQVIDKSATNNELVLAKRLGNFSAKVGRDSQTELHRLINEYRVTGRKFPLSVQRRLSELGLDHPTMEIFGGKAKQGYLASVGLSGEYALNDQLVLVIKMPKPLDAYWWKGGCPEDKNYVNVVDVSNMVIEWGYFYRGVREVIWDNIRYSQDNHRMNFNRISPKFEHVSMQYYYIFAVGRR